MRLSTFVLRGNNEIFEKNENIDEMVEKPYFKRYTTRRMPLLSFGSDRHKSIFSNSSSQIYMRYNSSGKCSLASNRFGVNRRPSNIRRKRSSKVFSAKSLFEKAKII